MWNGDPEGELARAHRLGGAPARPLLELGTGPVFDFAPATELLDGPRNESGGSTCKKTAVQGPGPARLWPWRAQGCFKIGKIPLHFLHRAATGF
jgi:hypothetical protein